MCSGSARKVNTKSKDFYDKLLWFPGKKDIIPISEAKYLAENIKKSKILILENEGHCSYAKKKYWYDIVKNFINDNIN